MKGLIRTIVTEYGWIHRALGLAGNCSFLTGSVLFLPQFESWKTIGVCFFIAGAVLMLIGALGEFFVRLPFIRREADDD